MAMILVSCHLLSLLLVLLRFALVVILHRLKNIIFLDRDTFGALDLAPLDEDHHTSKYTAQTSQSDPYTRPPRRPSESVPMPHPDTKEDLKDRVEHVHVDDEVDGPGP